MIYCSRALYIIKKSFAKNLGNEAVCPAFSLKKRSQIPYHLEKEKVTLPYVKPLL